MVRVTSDVIHVIRTGYILAETDFRKNTIGDFEAKNGDE
jgi:hypothetical protein